MLKSTPKNTLLNKIIGYKYILVVTNDETQKALLNNSILNELKSHGHYIFIAQNSENHVDHNDPNIHYCNLRAIPYYQHHTSYDQFICYLNDNETEYTIDIINFLNKHAGAIINITADTPMAGLEKIFQMILYPRKNPASAGSEFLIKTLISQCFDYIVCLTNNAFSIYERKQEFHKGTNLNSCYVKVT